MKLYDGGRAPNPRRVRIFFAEKGIPLPEIVAVDIGQKEHLTDAFARLNPVQRLPVLELDDGTALAETIAICRYIESLHPQPPLFGRDAKEQALIEMWSRRVELGLFAAVTAVFRHGHPSMAELEDHDTVDRNSFNLEKLRGAFALDWEAHGLCYGIPAAIEDAMADGRVVVVNTSRKIIELALEKYPRCFVLLVTATPEVRAKRLSGRGRETAQEVAARLAREGAPIPTGVDAVTIDNSGTLPEGIANFVDALRRIAG